MPALSGKREPRSLTGQIVSGERWEESEDSAIGIKPSAVMDQASVRRPSIRAFSRPKERHVGS